MNTIDVGQQLVELCNANRSDLAVAKLYRKDIVSVEAAASTIEGIAGVNRNTNGGRPTTKSARRQPRVHIKVRVAINLWSSLRST